MTEHADLGLETFFCTKSCTLLKKAKTSPVLAPLSVTQRSALAERGSRDNCLRMLPLNQSERIRVQDVDFTRLKMYLWRVRLATLGKLFKFSSRLTWRIGMSVACLHFH